MRNLMSFSPSKFMIGALSTFAVLQVVGAVAALKSPPPTPLTAEQLSDPRNIDAKIPSDPSKNCWWFDDQAVWMTGKDCTITQSIDSQGNKWHDVQSPTGSRHSVRITSKDKGLLRIDGSVHQMKVEKHPVLGYRFTGGKDWDIILRLS